MEPSAVRGGGRPTERGAAAVSATRRVYPRREERDPGQPAAAAAVGNEEFGERGNVRRKLPVLFCWVFRVSVRACVLSRQPCLQTLSAHI